MVHRHVRMGKLIRSLNPRVSPWSCSKVQSGKPDSGEAS